MHYLILVVLLATHAGAGYVGFVYGQKVLTAAQSVKKAL